MLYVSLKLNFLKIISHIKNYFSKDFLQEPKVCRQEKLEKYGFVCDCLACEKDLPMRHKLDSGPVKMYATYSKENLKQVISENKLTPTLALEKLQEFYKVLNQLYEPDSFSKDYEIFIDCVIICLTAIASPVERIQSI